MFLENRDCHFGTSFVSSTFKVDVFGESLAKPDQPSDGLCSSYRCMAGK